MSIKLQPRKVITCPHCGYQYLPGEVLFPDQVLGQPRPHSIIRDALGKILYEEYNETQEPIAEDSWICDNCEKQFVIEIETNYKVKKEVEELDFTQEYCSLL